MIVTHITYSESHENAPPWRTQVVVRRADKEICRVCVNKISAELWADAVRTFQNREWLDFAPLNAAISAYLARWVS